MKVRAFEEFIGVTFFGTRNFVITPRDGDDVLHVQIGNTSQDENSIVDLGDGIQAIITLTYPLFFNEGEDAIICYEEPETHLHPRLQRLFLETLRDPRFKTFKYFISTHSNHFLDLTADYNDLSVFTFRRSPSPAEKRFLIENVEAGDSNILQLLGVRASSVFFSNCTIWVEGITDRLYLRKYLDFH